MYSKRQISTKTPNTLIIGIASNGNGAAVTGAMVLENGDTELDIIELIGSDLWETVTVALDELAAIHAKQLLLLTTDAALHGFLQAPLYVEQPTVKKVRVGRDFLTARVGGNEHQWKMLRQLFCYSWRCEKVATLAKAERLLNNGKN